MLRISLTFRDLLRAGCALGAALCFFSIGYAAPVTPIQVNPSNMHGWAFQVAAPGGVGNMVNGPATPPFGAGSAHFNTGSDGSGHVEIRQSGYDGVLLSSLNALSYSEYATSWNTQQVPYLMLNIDQTNSGSVSDNLFFEPAYQNASDGSPLLPDQGTPVLNAWQTWDALNGGWWSANGDAGLSAGNGVKSLATYIAAFPDAVIRNSSLGGIRLLSGFASPSDVFDGNVDAFTIGTGGSATIYDFNPVPEPASLALAAIGLSGLGWLAKRRAARRERSTPAMMAG